MKKEIPKGQGRCSKCGANIGTSLVNHRAHKKICKGEIKCTKKN